MEANMESEKLFGLQFFLLNLCGLTFKYPNTFKGFMIKFLVYLNIFSPFIGTVLGIYMFIFKNFEEIIEVIGPVVNVVEALCRFCSFYYQRKKFFGLLQILMKTASDGTKTISSILKFLQIFL